jgi:hypothetical protein
MGGVLLSLEGVGGWYPLGVLRFISKGGFCGIKKKSKPKYV